MKRILSFRLLENSFAALYISRETLYFLCVRRPFFPKRCVFSPLERKKPREDARFSEGVFPGALKAKFRDRGSFSRKKPGKGLSFVRLVINSVIYCEVGIFGLHFMKSHVIMV